MNTSTQLARSEDQRISERIIVTLAGKLFVPAEETTLDCTVVNLSTGGAGVYCPEPPPLAAFVVLYVDGFGRFDAVTTRFVNGELGLRFICKDAKRKRLEQDLTAFVMDGMKGVTRLRRYQRAVASSEIYHFTCANGDQVPCLVQDVSIQGAMLNTTARPALGELIQLGQTCGWVVRHHENGIGVQFKLRPQYGQTDGR
jgi:PilZ domain